VSSTKRAKTERNAAPAAEHAIRDLSNTLGAVLLGEMGDLEGILETLTRWVSEHLGGVCTVELFDGDGDYRTLAVAAPTPEARELILKLLAFEHLGPISAEREQTTRNGEVWVSDDIELQALPALSGAERALLDRTRPIRSAGAPLVVGGEVVGVLNRTRSKGPPVGDDDIAEIEALARLAAVAVENARMQQSLARSAVRSRILDGVNRALTEVETDYRQLIERLARLVADTLGDLCVLQVLTPDAELIAEGLHHVRPKALSEFSEVARGLRHAVGAGIAGKVVATGEAQFLPKWSVRRGPLPFDDYLAFHERQGTHSIICVPMLAGTEVLGAIFLSRDRTPEPFSEDDLTLAASIATQAGLLIQNARLYESLRGLNRTLEEQVRDRTLDLLESYEQLDRQAQVLVESESLMRAMLDAIPDIVTRVDRAGRMLDAHMPQAERGLSGQIVGHRVDDFLGAEIGDDVREAVATVLDGAPTIVRERSLQSETGRWTHIEARYAACGEDEAVVVVRDITEQRQAQEQLRRSESLFRTGFRSSPLGMALLDVDSRFVDLNEAFVSMLGRGHSAVVGHREAEFTHPEDARHAVDVEGSFASGILHSQMVKRYERPDGSVVWARLAPSWIHDEEGAVAGVLLLVQDITEQRRADASLRESRNRQRALLDAMPDSMLRIGRDGTFLDVSSGPEDFWALPPGELMGRNVRDVLPPDLAHKTMQCVVTALLTSGVESFEYGIDLPGGPSDFEARVVASGPDEAIVIVRDITDRKRAEQEARHLALHDPLTGLANRRLLLDRLAHALTRLERGGCSAVLFCDLDRFKVVNDTLGHSAGDMILRIVAERLRETFRGHDTIARIGGDEFVVIVEDLDDAQDAAAAGERLQDALRAPMAVAGADVFTTASIGIAIATTTEVTPDDLLRHADTAMYRAKDGGRARYEIFDEDVRSSLRARLEMESDLHRALDRRELELVYQPVVDLTTGGVVAFEALLRWDRAGVKTLPADFLEIAEETGLIVPIGAWVLHTAATTVQRFERLLPEDYGLHINVSARQLADAGFVGSVRAALDATGVNPRSLVLELTESTLIADPLTARSRVSELTDEVGVRIAIDDFGTGYSSMSHLVQFPLDVVKIDRSFVERLGEDEAHTTIVAAAVQLG